MMSKFNEHHGSPADPDSNLSAAGCLSDAQAEFAAHMYICQMCYEMQPCWRMEEICHKLIAAGLFRSHY